MKQFYTPLSLLPVFCLCLLLSATSLQGLQAQQTLPKPKLWLKSDTEVNPVLGWVDASGNQLHARVQASALPELKAEFNYHSALEFDGLNDSLSSPLNLEHSAEMTLMAVYFSADTLERGVWGTKNAIARPLMLSTQRAAGPDSVIDAYGNHGKQAVLNTIVQTWDKAPEFAEDAAFAIGAAGSLQPEGRLFKGRLAELLVFDRALGFLERKQYETYLAIKFGVPVREGNYISADQQVLWRMSEHQAFAHRMAGIGRADAFKLHQKQSRSMLDTAELLVLSVGTLAQDNAANPENLQAGDYLIWGDNNQALETLPVPESDTSLAFLQRRWLITAAGEAAQLKTELRIKTKHFPQDSLGYWLVIDRSGKGNFAIDQLDYILPDSIIGDTLAVYKNIQWDTDRSGSDQFSFARAKTLLAVVRTLADPSCLDREGGMAAVELIGGAAPYYYTLNNPKAEISRSREGDARWELSQLPAGNYALNVNDAEGSELARTFSLSMPDALQIALGEDRQLEEGGELYLDASANIPDSLGVGYAWQSNFGFSSSEPRIRISENGVYRVTVTTAEGCTFSDEIAINGASEARYLVFPSVSGRNQPFNIGISLTEPGDVRVQIFRLNGPKKEELQGRGQMEYLFRPSLAEAGMYLVVVDTPQGRESSRIIIL